jgi:hypothetical protein
LIEQQLPPPPGKEVAGRGGGDTPPSPGTAPHEEPLSGLAMERITL